MTLSAADLTDQTQQHVENNQQINPPKVRLIISSDQTHYVFYRNQLIAQYQKNDNYARNMVIVQLFLCCKVSQKILSQVFQLTAPHLSLLVNKFRKTGSPGIQDRTIVRIGNNQKIKGKVADEIIKQLNVGKENRPTYASVMKLIKKKYGVQLSPQRISCWWKEVKQEKLKEADNSAKLEKEELAKEKNKPAIFKDDEVEFEVNEVIENNPIDDDVAKDKEFTVDDVTIGEDWQPNIVAGSFILYTMLNASQFLTPFIDILKKRLVTCSKAVERVMLTLFFSHALRLKSIEQTKHLIAAHFGPLVLGDFCRTQNLRYAIDDIIHHKNFDKAITEHYKNMAKQTNLGDEIYYTDGHFSCYYGKYPIPKGYDARRKQAARGRNTIYLHNSLGHNILSFESPTNTSLSRDIVTLIGKMKVSFGDLTGKNLFFDRGGFAADCFKQITKARMYFTTFLKSRKKESEIDENLFKEIKITFQGIEFILRIIYFIGKQGKNSSRGYKNVG